MGSRLFLYLRCAPGGGLLTASKVCRCFSSCKLNCLTLNEKMSVWALVEAFRVWLKLYVILLFFTLLILCTTYWNRVLHRDGVSLTKNIIFLGENIDHIRCWFYSNSPQRHHHQKPSELRVMLEWWGPTVCVCPWPFTYYVLSCQYFLIPISNKYFNIKELVPSVSISSLTDNWVSYIVIEANLPLSRRASVFYISMHIYRPCGCSL